MNTSVQEVEKLQLLEQLWKVDGKLVNSKNNTVFETMPEFWMIAYEGQKAPVGAVVQLSRTRFYLVKG